MYANAFRSTTNSRFAERRAIAPASVQHVAHRSGLNPRDACSSYTRLQSFPSSSRYSDGSEQEDLVPLNPLERWKRLGTSWFGVVCEFEGIFVSDISTFQRIAWRTLAAEENLRYPTEYDMEHRQNMKSDQLISQIFNWTHNKEEIRRLSLRKQEILFKQLEGYALLIKPGALKLLALLRSNGIPCILISQYTKADVQHLLIDSPLQESISFNFSGAQQDAQIPLITADDVRFGLPDAECISLCASMLHRPYERLMIIGGSLQVLEAATELGAHTIMVAGKRRAWELQRADLVVNTLEEICFQNLKNLLNEV